MRLAGNVVVKSELGNSSGRCFAPNDGELADKVVVPVRSAEAETGSTKARTTLAAEGNSLCTDT